MRLTLLLLALLTALPAAAQVPSITPYPGSRAAGSTRVAEYAEYELQRGPANGKTAPQKVAGRVTRLFFLGPKDRSLLEIFTNYEEALRKDGFGILFRCAGKECGSGKTREMDSGFNQTVEQYYLAARKSSPNGATYAAVMVNDRYNPAARIHIIEVKPMQTGLVKMTADQMSKDIAGTGRVALYSILFDTGKADVKPESDPTLAEIAKLLQTNATLRIHVVGHTDNAGTYDANVDLSRRRAEAVVKLLTTRHAVSASRLHAVGVASVAPVATNRTADGRKLNRRVELVEQ